MRHITCINNLLYLISQELVPADDLGNTFIPEKMTDRNILSGLGDLLSGEQKKWAKENLRTDKIFLLKLALENG